MDFLPVFSNLTGKRALKWSNRFLSSAGKLVLLKSVLSTLPNYAMSCFQLPKSLCKRIQSTLTRFWWDSNDQKKKMCWIAWEKLTKTKKEGGLGFKDITAFNEALLAKISWRLINEPKGLLARVLLGKYCFASDIMKVKCPGSASHGWRSILVGRDLLKKQLGWAIGNGKTVRAWCDPWLSSSCLSVPMGPMPSDGKAFLVAELFENDSVNWNQEKVKETFPSWANDILAIKPSRFDAPDKRIWLATADGRYTTKSGYAVARGEQVNGVTPLESGGCNWIQEVWSIKASPKVKLFLWKSLVGAIPTGMQLVARGMHIDPACKKCNAPESICHLLFNCPFAKHVWQLAPLVGLEEMPNFSEVHKGLGWLREKQVLPPSGIGIFYPWICWNLWLARNQRCFNNRVFTEAETLLKAILNAREWQEAQLVIKNVPKSLVAPRSAVVLDQQGRASVTSDAAWNQNFQLAGLSWIFSSQEPSFPQRHSAVCEYVSSPLMAECLAIRSALISALEYGIQFLSLKTDSLVLAKALSKKSHLVQVHGVISDVFICISKFKSFSCNFIPRTANVEADALAKVSLSNFIVNL
ncbi:unnamed protein product [Arabidopsis halleri]